MMKNRVIRLSTKIERLTGKALEIKRNSLARH